MFITVGRIKAKSVSTKPTSALPNMERRCTPLGSVRDMGVVVRKSSRVEASDILPKLRHGAFTPGYAAAVSGMKLVFPVATQSATSLVCIRGCCGGTGNRHLIIRRNPRLGHRRQSSSRLSKTIAPKIAPSRAAAQLAFIFSAPRWQLDFGSLVQLDEH